MRILINVPKLELPGGVANHYKGLKQYWKEDVIYNVIGKRRAKRGTGKYWLLIDLLIFIFKLSFLHIDVVLLNPSLGKSAIIRDSLFLKIAFFLRKKIVVLIHGWEQSYADVMDRKSFVQTFNKASLILVLANDFKKQLIGWGITVPINLTTTKVDDTLIKDFDIMIRNKSKVRNILFLSRIEKEKGIFITLEAYRLLLPKYSDLTLTVVGSGEALENVRKYVLENKLDNVLITGNLNGDKLRKQFERGDIYIFPTYFGEGMPTSVLEAMAFGLPVLTRPNAGLADFFDSEKMGFCSLSLDPHDYARNLDRFLSDMELYRKVAFYNYQYAKKNFLASKVAKQLEEYCISL